MIKFEVGKTYSCRSACDHECIFSYTVVARTRYFLTLEDKRGVQFRRKVFRAGFKAPYDAVEKCNPQGVYSMCPVLSADREG